MLLFGTYLPPPTTLSGSVNLPAATRSTRVPQEILTEALIEEIKTRCCLVGTPLDAAADLRLGAASDAGDEGNELDVPSEITPSEPESMELDTESIATSSVFSAVSHPRAAPGSVGRPSRGGDSPNGRLEALAAMYARHSTATDLRMRVVPPSAQQTGTGRGTLVIPGWIRERAAEVLFEGGDVDESSVAETILDSLLKVGTFATLTNFELPANQRALPGSHGPPQNSRVLYRRCRRHCDASGLHTSCTRGNSERPNAFTALRTPSRTSWAAADPRDGPLCTLATTLAPLCNS